MNIAQELLSRGDDAAIALVCGAREVTYRELRDAVARAGGLLRTRGVQAGDRVVVLGADSVAWVVAWLGALWVGAVGIGLNPRTQAEDLGVILLESHARLCLADPEAAGSLATSTLLMPLQVIDLDAVEALPAQAIPAHPCEPEDVAFWLYSSGTTGRPKAIVHRHACVAGCAAFARDVLGVTATDRLYATSKLFFAYPLANSLFAGLLLGATVVLDERWPEPAGVADVVARHRPTVLFSVPTLFHRLLDAGVAGAIGQAGVRCCVSAGEGLPKAVAQRWRETTGVGILGGYGMTETLALVLYADPLHDPGGRPAPLAEVRADPPADPSAPQRLWFRHPSLALGYHDRADLQRRIFRDGWCSSGDLFYPSDDGSWRFAGREDALLKVAGRWVDTQAVQGAVACGMGALLQELAVLGIAGAEGLTGLALYVVASRDVRAAAQARLAEVAARLPAHQQPRWVYWLDMLPRTPTGKLSTAGLREHHVKALTPGAASS
jgi:acyl-coenzyme A synthetase/AMP-(fatty) acid ligase